MFTKLHFNFKFLIAKFKIAHIKDLHIIISFSYNTIYNYSLQTLYNLYIYIYSTFITFLEFSVLSMHNEQNLWEIKFKFLVTKFYVFMHIVI